MDNQLVNLFEYDVAKWNKNAFINAITKLLESDQLEQDKLTVLMLAESVETFIKCNEEISLNGLVVVHSNGVQGKNHHLEIRDKAIYRSLQLMAELKLTPKYRKPQPEKLSPEWEAFLNGGFGAIRSHV